MRCSWIRPSVFLSFDLSLAFARRIKMIYMSDALRIATVVGFLPYQVNRSVLDYGADNG